MRCHRRADGGAGPAFFERAVLIHTHIERTAGTSLRLALADLLGAGHVHNLNLPGAALPHLMAQDDRRKIWALTGHFPFASMDWAFARKPVYLASVREPVERFLSYYAFVTTSPGHPGNAFLAGKTPDQAIAAFLARDPPLVVNDMSATLGISRRRDIASHLEKNYAIVAPRERINELIAKLYAIFGGDAAPTKIHNAGPGEATAIEPSSRLLFRSRNQTDSALYEYVSERFDSWLNDLEARLWRKRTAGAARFRSSAPNGLGWRQARPGEAGGGASAYRPLDRRFF
jgi:hypothetical protein